MDSRGVWYQAYIIKRYKFDDLPPVMLVHFKGWSRDTDEFIREADASKRIRPRNAATATGQMGAKYDGTVDNVRKLYDEKEMKLRDEYSIEAAKGERQDLRRPDVTGGNKRKNRTRRRRHRSQSKPAK